MRENKESWKTPERLTWDTVENVTVYGVGKIREETAIYTVFYKRIIDLWLYYFYLFVRWEEREREHK